MRLEINAGGLETFYTGISQLLYTANSTNSITNGLQVVINRTNGLEGGVGTLASAVSSLQARITLEQNRRYAVQNVRNKTESFVSTAIVVDDRVASMISTSFEQFYQVNPWLRPCPPATPGWFERFWNSVKDIASILWEAIVDWYIDVRSGITEALMGIGISLSAIISITSQLFSPFTERNYNHNLNFEFRDFIHDQRSQGAQLKMGGRYGSYNGCAWIATFNAALLLGEFIHPADIISHYETKGGALINGEFGINPLAIKTFFQDQGFEANMQNFPPSVDEQIKNSSVSVLTYFNPFPRAHTVMVYYDNGIYYIYNDTNANSTPTAPGIQTSVENGWKVKRIMWYYPY